MNFVTKVICTASQVSKMTSRHDATHVLSLMDPGSKVFLHPKRKVVWKKFIFEDNTNEGELFSPTREHVKEMVKWAKTLPDDANLLVHCFAGVSRSSATAIVVECSRNNVKSYDEIKEIFDYMAGIRPIMMPNPLIIRFADDEMRLNGNLIQNLNDYMKDFEERNKHIPILLIRGEI